MILLLRTGTERRDREAPASVARAWTNAGAPATLDAPELALDPRQAAVAEPISEASREPGPALGQGAPARAFLAQHYGARWPEVEARIEAWGQIDLDMPYFQRPWEEVEGEFVASLPMLEQSREALVQARVRWPEEVTPQFLAQEFARGGRRYELDASDTLAIDALVTPKNDEIAQLARLSTQRIDAHVLDRWATGKYLRAPFTTGGLSDEVGFHSVSTGGHGWAITITLTREECPDVLELEHEIEVLSKERDRMVFAYLDGKTAR